MSVGRPKEFSSAFCDCDQYSSASDKVTPTLPCTAFWGGSASIMLDAGGAQAGKAVTVNRLLPREEFLDC